MVFLVQKSRLVSRQGLRKAAASRCEILNIEGIRRPIRVKTSSRSALSEPRSKLFSCPPAPRAEAHARRPIHLLRVAPRGSAAGRGMRHLPFLLVLMRAGVLATTLRLPVLLSDYGEF